MTTPTMELPTIESVDDAMGTVPMFDEPQIPPGPPGTKTGDVHAPYGYTADGKPRGKPGRRPSGNPPAPKKTAAKAPPPPPAKRTSVPKPPPSKSGRVDYTPGLAALAGQFIGPAAIIAVAKQDSRLLADCAAVTTGIPAMGEVANWAAEKWPVAAAILDKVVAFGAVAGPAGGLMLMAAQIGVNHGLIPPGLIPGTLPPASYAEQFLAQKMADDADFASAVEAIVAARQNVQRMATQAA